ncbi:putative acetyltransferase [Nakamurella sp. UYEF19]|uniref:hypothetical protein n=1 Tax=Nakamurella sp. UYEF19 TaxID=1756392 RepID=UPI003399C3BD
MSAGPDTPSEWLAEMHHRQQAIHAAVEAVVAAAAAVATTTADAAAAVLRVRLTYYQAIANARNLIGTRSDTRRALGITPHTLRTALSEAKGDD